MRIFSSGMTNWSIILLLCGGAPPPPPVPSRLRRSALVSSTFHFHHDRVTGQPAAWASAAHAARLSSHRLSTFTTILSPANPAPLPARLTPPGLALLALPA